ncbi:spermidine synthase [Saccharopolyspora antimicrobica]|uniref:spermidine synthase n=1 Tax=Saccharopolyspora antimicrobica TaxID=455193 RepID=UPI000B825538|nr:fused MFS/spermidine synthase [Saccharopolyspora antimicrobica]
MSAVERVGIERAVWFGDAELIPDPHRAAGWTVAVDGISQSFVDLADPTYLKFPYVAWIAQAVDRHWPPGTAVSATYLGGAGCTLPRYVAATRPGSAQTAFELDEPLVELVREHLALDEVPGLEVRVQDGRAGIREAPDGSTDLVVLDVFRAGSVATELATVEFLTDLARVLRPGGLCAANLWDGGELEFALRAVAAVGEVFPHVLVLAEPAVLLRHRAGNIVVVASTRDLPKAGLDAWGAAAANRMSCLTLPQLAAVAGTAAPLTEATPHTAPVPPVRKERF